MPNDQQIVGEHEHIVGLTEFCERLHFDLTLSSHSTDLIDKAVVIGGETRQDVKVLRCFGEPRKYLGTADIFAVRHTILILRMKCLVSLLYAVEIIVITSYDRNYDEQFTKRIRKKRIEF